MNELIVSEKHLAVYDIQEKVLSEFVEAEKIKCNDAKSRKMLGKFRADAKSIRSKIEKARLEKNRAQIKLNNDAAEAIKNRLTKSIDAYDAEILPYDQIAIDKANEKKRLEEERIKAINYQLESLTKLCATAVEFNIQSERIEFRLNMIEQFHVDEETFQEMLPQAELLKLSGVSNAKLALKSRIEWELQQKENERIRIENEARQADLDRIEAERLEKIRIEAEARSKEDAEKKAKADKEAAEIKAREDAIKAREDAAKAEEQKQRDHELAIAENLIFDEAYAWAKEIDAEIEKKRLEADKERAIIIAEDKKIIDAVLQNIVIYDIQLLTDSIHKLKTEESQKILNDLCLKIGLAIEDADSSLFNLA